MKAIIKLQARAFFKNPASIFGILISTVLLLIFGTMMNDMTVVVANVITITIITTGLMSFGMIIFELRKSIIMKRIGATSITKPMAIFAFFIWATIEAMMTLAWIFILTILFQATNYANFGGEGAIVWASVSWIGLLWAVFWGILASLSLGFLFVSISPNFNVFNMYTMLYFFLASFVGGLFFPGAQANWMTYIGYAVPHTYVSDMIASSFAGADVWSATGYELITPFLSGSTSVENWIQFATGVDNGMWEGFAIVSGTGTDAIIRHESTGLILNYVVEAEMVYAKAHSTVSGWKSMSDILVPVVSTGIFSVISAKTFKWDSQ